MNDTLVSFLKSKIVWVQLLAVAGLFVEQYGTVGYINPSLAGFIIFTITVILQKFASSEAIVTTYVSRDNTMFWINVIAALIMVVDYALQNQIFGLLGIDSAKVVMTIATLNMILRVWFINQPFKPGTEEIED